MQTISSGSRKDHQSPEGTPPFKINVASDSTLTTFKESVKYFVQKGSKVHCLSLDASKAFDKVLHNGLFVKLINKGVPAVFIRLLCN